MRFRGTTRRARAALAAAAVVVTGVTVGAATVTPAHASSDSRGYDVEIAQSCVMASIGGGRYAPADEVTITVIDWEDPLDYINFDINFSYRIQADPLSPPTPNTNAGSVHMSHGSFVQSIKFKIYFPPAQRYLRVESVSPGSTEHHIRQLQHCGAPL
jgi:hypothetical protein